MTSKNSPPILPTIRSNALSIRGDELSLLSRIMAVVDIYDALVSDRPYRTAMSKEKALLILMEAADAGKLDKEVVNHLIAIKEMRFHNE